MGIEEGVLQEREKHVRLESIGIEENALQEGAKCILLKLIGIEEDVLRERKKHFLLKLESMTQWRWRAHAPQYGTLQDLQRGGKDWRRTRKGRKRKRAGKEWMTRGRGRFFWTSLMDVTGYVPGCVTLTNDACASWHSTYTKHIMQKTAVV